MGHYRIVVEINSFFIAQTELATLYRYCAVFKEMRDLRSMIVYGF